MNFNIYLDSETAKTLSRLAANQRRPRNSLIREAVSDWIERRSSRWPDEVLKYTGDEHWVPFEAHRAELVSPNPDPFESDTQSKKRARNATPALKAKSR